MRRSLRVGGVWLPSLLVCANLFGQSASPSHHPSTFHVSGTITQLGRALPNQWVSFEGASSKFVKADSAGRYEADLPLGIWKAAVVVRAGPISTDSSVSRPRLFHVTTPAHVTLDLFVRPPVMCGSLRVITPGGRPPTAEEEEKKNESCVGQQFFPVPTNDGTAFEVAVGGLDHNLCSLTTGNHAACEREFATYNLFTIQADKVVFTAFPNGGLLEASDGVVVNDGHPEHCRDSVRFLIANGQAVEAY